MSTRKTLKDFLNANGYASVSGISYSISKDDSLSLEGDDLSEDPNTGKPLLGESGILGDYLKHITDNNTNFHKFKGGNEESSPSIRGNPLQQAHDQGTETVFINTDNDAFNTLSSYSNSGLMDDPSDLTIQNSIDKIGETNSSSQNILLDVKGTPLASNNQVLNSRLEDTTAQKLSYQLINNNNRFSPAKQNSAFKDNNVSINDFESSRNIDDINRVSGTFLMQNKFGKYSKEESDGKISLNDLKGIGISMLLRAGGWDLEQRPSEGIDTDNSTTIKSEVLNLKIGDIAENRSVIDSTDQLKTDLNNYRSKNSYTSPAYSASGDSVRAGRNESSAQRVKGQSSLYNTEFNFTSKNSNLIKYQAASALLSINKLFTEQLEVIENFTTGQSLTSDNFKIEDFYSGRGPFAYGTSKTSGLNIIDFVKKNILVDTKYAYNVCFKTGMKIMFGIESNDDDFKDIANSSNHSFLDDSPGYWQSVSFSIIRRHKAVLDKLEFTSNPIHNFISLIDNLRENSILHFMNVMATVGNSRLISTQGSEKIDKNTLLPIDVDALKDNASTRVMKGRKLRGYTKLERSTSQRSLPAAYLLPGNVINATVKMGTTLTGQNPSKGMLGSGLADKTYIDRNLNKSFNKIPIDIIRKLEDKLEGEYVPFYIQDLRTNELIAFNAFLTGLKDTISPSFDSKSGYGRMDSVKIYKETTRSVDVSFILHSTSKEDFDEMWYKINKITTLLYPQWTQGTTLKSGNAKFIQPFSQVLAASPIVRLRVGDIIKSNYSKFNLGRMHGLGDDSMNLVPQLEGVAGGINQFKQNVTESKFMKFLSSVALEAFYAMAGSPLQYKSNLQGSNRIVNRILDVASDAVSEVLVNGFVNPLIIGQLLNQMKDPDTNEPGAVLNKKYGYREGQFSFAFLKANLTKGYLVDGRMVKTSKNLKCRIVKVIRPDENPEIPESMQEINKKQTASMTNKSADNFNTFKRKGFVGKRTKYKIKIVDLSAPKSIQELEEFSVFHSDLSPDYSSIYNESVGPLLSIQNPVSVVQEGVKGLVKNVASKAGVGSDVVDALTEDILSSEASQFISSTNNPFTRAFESSMGRGLAGVLNGITFDWLDADFGWETDFNSRAPIGCKISFKLDVIHDLPPGLDHGGYNRAPLYNVGEAMKHIAGDPNDRLVNAEYAFKNGDSYAKKLFKK